jgi:hypothetical protein
MSDTYNRAEWLASLKVGDRIAWMQWGTVRATYTIERETPKCWIVSSNWLVEKINGRSRNCISGIMFEPCPRNWKAIMTAQERAAERHKERRVLLARVSRFSTKKLRSICEVRT